MIIRNTEELLSHGNIAGRKVVLDILEAGLRASDPYENIRRMVRVEGGKLIVGDDPVLGVGRTPLVFDLDKVGHIYVVGGGKAAQRQAKGLEDALGDFITAGHINAKKGEPVELRRIGVTMAGHPVPDEDSVAGSQKIYDLLQRAQPNDIVFSTESGGGSALLTLPAPGITLQDIRDLTRVLYFEAGATMWDINSVRGMIVMLRSRSARYVGDATYIHFATAEKPAYVRVLGVGRRPPRRLTNAEAYDQAIETLHNYGCWDKVPESIRTFLLARDPRYGPLRREEVAGKPHYDYRIMGPEYMLNAACARASELGITPTIMASSLSDVEARAVGEVFGYMSEEAEKHQRPLKPPCVMLCGGELLVTVGDGDGIGGRNQEFALSVALRIAGSARTVAASVDSDGTDGPTTWAGGIVDGETVARAGAAGFDLARELRRHNTHGVLKTLGDSVFTGARGTNIQDLRVVYVSA